MKPPRAARGSGGPGPKASRPPAPRTSPRPARAGDSRAARYLGLFALFAAAVVWRWAYLARLSHTPFAGSLNADARIYWDWSEFILRHGVLPPSPFYLAPLYPYVLAGWRVLVAGAGVSQWLTAQALMGATAVTLLADATRRLAGWPAALVVGVALAFSQAGTFFDGLVLPEPLLFFIESLLIWFVARTDWPWAGLSRFAGYGFLTGILALGRGNNAVLILLAPMLAGVGGALRLAPVGGVPPARRIKAIAVALAAFALCCLPSTLANHRASGELIPFTYNFGYNFYVGNNPEADGAFVDITRGSSPVPLEGTSPVTGGALDGRAYLLATEGRRLSPSQSSAVWSAKAAAFVRSAPGKAMALAGKKLMLALNQSEIPQIEKRESFARAAGPLGVPLIGSYGFIAILGLAGLAWAVRRGPGERWLAGYMVLISLSMVPFFVTDRYRHHLVPALAVLGGLTVTGIQEALRRRAGAGLLRPVLALGAAAAIVLAPIQARQVSTGEWSFDVDRGIRLLEQGAYAEAAASFAKAERSLGNLNLQSLTTGARTDLAAFHFRYGLALEALGRQPEAIARWEKAIATNPNDVWSLGRLDAAYELAGRTADRERVHRVLVATPGGRGQLLTNDGWSAARRGDLAAAEKLFLEAVATVPDLPVAWEGLLRVRIQAGRYSEASQALEQARGAGLNLLHADIYEAFLDVQRGDLNAARRILDRMPGVSFSRGSDLGQMLEYTRRALAARGPGPIGGPGPGQ